MVYRRIPLIWGSEKEMLHFAPEPQERNLAQETEACYSTVG